MPDNEISFNNIGIDADDDIIWITVKKYKLFLTYDKIGMDAFLLYCHLIFTCRLQGTNQVKANNIYIRNGLKWTKERLRKAKNLLFDLNIIQEVKRRDQKGKITGLYLKVNTKTTPFEIESTDLKNQQVDSPVDWKNNPKCFNKETNALTKKTNALTTDKKSAIETLFIKWNNTIYLRKHKNINIVISNIGKKHFDIIDDLELNNIVKAIDNYDIIAGSDKGIYWFTHGSWTLWDFITRGSYKFVDEAKPLDNFKITDIKEIKRDKEEQEKQEYLRRLNAGEI